MTKYYTTPRGRNIQVCWGSFITASRGAKKVMVEVSYGVDQIHYWQTFKTVTHDMQAIDNIADMKCEARYEALYMLVESDIEHEIDTWIDNVLLL